MFKIGFGQFVKNVQETSIQVVNSEGFKNAKDYTKEKSKEAIDFTTEKGKEVMDAGSKAWDDTKKKSEELGVTQALVDTGSTLKKGTLVVVGVASFGVEKAGAMIEANPTLCAAKEKTISSLKTAGSKIGSTFNSYFGNWYKKP